MTEILATMAYISGGIALGFLVELPIYNTVSSIREKYQVTADAINKAQSQAKVV